MRLITLKALLLASLSSFGAVASEVQDSSNNVDVVDRWTHWPTVGSADLNFMFFDVYTSELRAPDGVYTVDNDITPHPVALAITYERNISKKHLLKETKKQWLHLGYSPTESEQWTQRLDAIYTDVATGEQLVYITDGQTGSFLYITQDGSTQLRGTITDEALNDAFLAIWLSPNTEYPKHRQQLIGMNQR
ncbi:chalcone isomerase family protein [Vibrio superstes]|uniref:Uncharacterized protein n=1 Tax=Vibrio superstes NBRC 103154 TaxID=1219062 RepID=A0A511QRU5_9VIBR|nr:chalcone isomerase family protein [Vibrio superstes]GEM80075.1 hypothetical protein VSU01S_23200 [Vibrio superstes NBRC 103154]